ncbi:zinc finger protein RFP-like [Eublepharis macularius]|uniref:Zinc finger protein RFP-like n=1 Tax=Eublepharis macularius TaxID=481883 RepID=A0AA97J9X9_EUBMA|nr:zinc finger protein RFP-like [Eublepharis macularius]
MAAEGPVRELCAEATCPICLQYFKNPVILACGHSFCEDCLTRCWSESRRDVCCPNCRATFHQKIFSPNRRLANVVEQVKKLEEVTIEEGKQGICEKHQEPLKLFCRDDETSICVVCDRSKEHREHFVVPTDEVFQEYKEIIEAQRKSVEKYRNGLVDYRLAEELGSQECLKQLELEKWKMKRAFHEMKTFLEGKEYVCLGELEGLERELENKHQENVTQLSEEISHLSNVMGEMEEKCQQPASEFLRDIRRTLMSYEKRQMWPEVELPPGLEWRLNMHGLKYAAIKEAMENGKESLEQAMKKEFLEEASNKGSPEEAQNKVNITLDPNTAHPRLILSSDLKSVRRENIMQYRPNNPERFDWEFCVLGRERFTSGRHWWDVEVEKQAVWALGVARESVRRKGRVAFSPDEGIWAIGKPFGEQFSPYLLLAFSSPAFTPCILKREPRKIQVFLDYEQDCVKFFDDSSRLIFIFHSASFSGEKICPYFCLGKWGVRLAC